MRVALVLIASLAAAGCKSKRSTEPAATPAPANEVSASPPPTGGAPAPGNAPIDHARATGVLGPTEGSAFAPLEKGGEEGGARGTGTGEALAAAKIIRGTVKIASASSGDLEQAVLKRIDHVQACYDRALGKLPKLAGEASWTLSIDADGKVTKAKVDKTTVKNTDVEDCVTRAVHGITLPKGAAGQLTLVLAFEPR